MKSWGDRILVRSDLCEELEAGEFVGLAFRSTDGYTGRG
jgi:hypothetical protein